MPPSNTERIEKERMKINPTAALLLTVFGAPILSLAVWGLALSGELSTRMDMHEKLPAHTEAVTRREFENSLGSLQIHLSARLSSLETTLNAILATLRAK